MEQVRYIAAMEQELARSVAQISSIATARVHLAAPKQSVFVRNRTPAKASVVVTPHQGRIISNSQVEAIIHMVSSSVPYLATDDVVVVDQRGKLLTDANRNASMQLSSSQMEHKLSIEENYRTRIEALLSSVVGANNVRSQVDVTMDFTEEEATFEEFDNRGVGPKARSEIISSEAKNSEDARLIKMSRKINDEKIKEYKIEPDFVSAIKLCKRRRIGPLRPNDNRELFVEKLIQVTLKKS